MIIDLKTIKKVYINLVKDVQKNRNIQEYFTNLGYSNYERFDAISLPKQKNCFNAGCSASHNTLMKRYRENVPFVLFEDDCKPTQWYSQYVVDGKIDVPDDADAVYLGYSTAGHDVWFRGESINDKWMRLKSCMATHSILFLNNKIDVFINNSDKTIREKEALDIGYAKEVLNNIKVYAPKKVLFYQNNGCVITTHVTAEPELNKWSSYNHDGSLNFDRQIIYDKHV
jgi:hypothetical protein